MSAASACRHDQPACDQQQQQTCRASADTQTCNHRTQTERVRTADVVHDVCEVKQRVAALPDARRLSRHVVPRRERPRKAHRREEHLQADHKVLQAAGEIGLLAVCAQLRRPQDAQRREQRDAEALPEGEEDDELDGHKFAEWLQGLELVVRRNVEKHEDVERPRLAEVVDERAVRPGIAPRELACTGWDAVTERATAVAAHLRVSSGHHADQPSTDQDSADTQCSMSGVPPQPTTINESLVKLSHHHVNSLAPGRFRAYVP